MKNYFLVILTIFFFNCNKKDDCVKIEDKREIDGFYYFYFKASGIGSSYTDSQGNVSTGGFAEDRWGSGKVSKEVFDSHDIGDEYCY